MEDEVRAALEAPGDFFAGPMPQGPDYLDRPFIGFTVRDGHYLSARWPGDAHRFGAEFAAMLVERHSQAA